ncbi:MAG: NGG1p interacting factor NIF3 [Clostridia bacterium]|nr:NGG1p interacting factor NIF3 [Clostridia bacterium]
MKIAEIYQLAVDKGIEADPRGGERVRRILEKTEEKFNALDKDEKSEFDKESINNPYKDTRILWGDPQAEVQRLLAGIDIGGEELLLADRFRDKGEGFDLVVSHHPEGRALAGLYGVMDVQEDILFNHGIPINVAEGIMAPRIKEVQRGLLPRNHNRSVDIARLLNIPFICVHTPADNLVVKYLENYFNAKEPETVGDIISLLKEIPEYKIASGVGAGPRCIVGSEESRAGKVFVDMTGGTGGSEKSYEKLANAGVGTVVSMHMSEKHRKEAEKNYINVVIAGHMASDSLGVNLFLDDLEVRGIEIVTCSGLIRHSRTKK